MKILHVSTHDNGGAANAAIRIHESLNKIGIDSSILFLNKTKKVDKSYLFNKTWQSDYPNTPDLTLRNYLKEKIFKTYAKQLSAYNSIKNKQRDFQKKLDADSLVKFELFSLPFTEFDITTHPEFEKADIIHLHFVSGFIDYKSFFKNSTKPVIWSLHDENAYLGVFHFEEDSVSNKIEYGIIDQNYREIKINLLKKYKKLGFIAGSNWIYEKIKKLSITEDRFYFRVNYPIDTNFYKPYDKKITIDFLKISEISNYEDKTILLFSAGNIKNRRKGFDLLWPILQKKIIDNFIILIMGEVEDKISHPNIIYLGSVSDERLMPIIYNAADYLILSSRAENFSYSKIESLCCGTPVLAFPIGDQEKFIVENDFGIIIDEFNEISIVNTLEKARLLKSTYKRDEISVRASVLFNETLIAKQISEAYNILLDS